MRGVDNPVFGQIACFLGRMNKQPARKLAEGPSLNMVLICGASHTFQKSGLCKIKKFEHLALKISRPRYYDGALPR